MGLGVVTGVEVLGRGRRGIVPGSAGDVEMVRGFHGRRRWADPFVEESSEGSLDRRQEGGGKERTTYQKND